MPEPRDADLRTLITQRILPANPAKKKGDAITASPFLLCGHHDDARTMHQPDQRSKRSRRITFVQALTKSRTNFSFASLAA